MNVLLDLLLEFVTQHHATTALCVEFSLYTPENAFLMHNNTLMR